MSPTFIIIGVLCFIILAVNTPSLTTWIGSLVKAKQQPESEQKPVSVSSLLPLCIPDFEGKCVELTITPDKALELRNQLTEQLEKVVK